MRNEHQRLRWALLPNRSKLRSGGLSGSNKERKRAASFAACSSARVGQLRPQRVPARGPPAGKIGPIFRRPLKGTGARRVSRYATCERSEISKSRFGRAGETTNQKSSRSLSPPRRSVEANFRRPIDLVLRYGPGSCARHGASAARRCDGNRCGAQ